jgi:hypothetical protein
MKKIKIILPIIAVAAIIIVFYIFYHKEVQVGKYTVVYYKNMSFVDPDSLPNDLESLKQLSGLIRITWQQEIAYNAFQEYSYIPGRGVEKTRMINKK